MATRRGGLGKGLEALFVENETTEITPTTLKIGEIEPNRGQPRRDFDETALAELADSIREHGVLQPLLVRPMPGGKYQIVAGERRWRASRMAGLTEVPVIIRDLDEAAAMEVALIENLQRSDLNPMEEALGYQELMERHGYTQEQVAKRVGKSRPAVANALRLLALPEETAALVREGKLSSGHARALLGLPDRSMIGPLAERITQEGLSVREAERLVADKGKLYPILTVRGGTMSPATAADAWGGFLLQKDPLWGLYLEDRLLRLRRAVSGLAKARDSTAEAKRQELSCVIAALEDKRREWNDAYCP